MATLADIRAGLATRLGTIRGVKASAYMLANVTPPAVWVRPDTVDYHRSSQGGMVEWTFAVQAVVGTAGDRAAQETLDELIAPSGSRSVRAAIEADPTLGGVAQDTIVDRCAEYAEVALADGRVLLSATWSVRVLSTQ